MFVPASSFHDIQFHQLTSHLFASGSPQEPPTSRRDPQRTRLRPHGPKGSHPQSLGLLFLRGDRSGDSLAEPRIDTKSHAPAENLKERVEC